MLGNKKKSQEARSGEYGWGEAAIHAVWRRQLKVNVLVRYPGETAPIFRQMLPSLLQFFVEAVQ